MQCEKAFKPRVSQTRSTIASVARMCWKWINGATRKTVRSTAFKTKWKMGRAYLDKSDISGLLAEALTADIETVFSNKTSLVCADSASGMLAVA